jgi:hypothetical protein
MAVRYHFDLYPRDDPKNGARLVRFTQLQSAEYRDEANGTGSGRISLRGDTSDAAFIDPDGLQYVRVVRDRDGDEAVVGGFWLDNGDFELLTERGTRLLTFAGPGTLAYLQRAQMWSHVYFSTYPGIFSADDPIDGVYSADQMETTPRLGYIFWRWMIQATLFRFGTTPYTHRHFDGVQATDIHEDDRTENPLPDLSFGFDGDDDSNGNAWSNPFGDFEVPVGEDMLSVAQRCMSAGLYVSMDPDTFELNAWDVEDHRRTRTGSAWATDVIRFQAPTDGTPPTGNIKSDAKRGVAPFIQRSVVLAGGDNTYRRSSAGAGDIAWEGFSGSSSDDDDFLERVAAMQLRARSDATDAIRLRMKLGSDRENGAYLPFEHVRVDDLVTVHTGTSAWDLDEAEFPVAAITIKQRDGGDFDAWVDLGSGYSSMADRSFQGQVVRSHRHPPNPRLCIPGTAPTDEVLTPLEHWTWDSGAETIANPHTAADTPFLNQNLNASTGSSDQPPWGSGYVRPGTGTNSNQFDVSAGTLYRHRLEWGRFLSPSIRWRIRYRDAGASIIGHDTLYSGNPSGNVAIVSTGDFTAPTGAVSAELIKDRPSDGSGVAAYVGEYSMSTVTAGSGGGGGDGHPDLVGTDGRAARCDHRHDVHRDRAPTTSDDADAGYKLGTIWAQLDDLDNPTEIIAVWMLVDAETGLWLSWPGGTGGEDIPTDLFYTTTDGTDDVTYTAASGSAHTIEEPTANVQDITLDDDCTFTMPSPVDGKSFVIRLRQDGTGGHSATFTDVLWPDSTAPTLSTDPDAVDFLTFHSDGTEWYGLYAGAGGASGRWEVVMTGSGAGLEPVTNDAETDWLYALVSP